MFALAAMRRWSATAGLAVALVVARPASAQNRPAAPPTGGAPAVTAAAKAQSTAYYIAASRSANGGRWDDAYAEYSIAWRLSPDWQTAGGLGKAAYRTKHHATAVSRLSDYLRQAPAGRVSARERTEAEGWIAVAKTKVGSLSVALPRGATVLIDGETAGTAPFQGAIPIDPGKHEIQIQTGSSVETRTVEITVGKTHNLSLSGAASGQEEQDPAAPAAGRATSSGPSLRTVALVGGAALTVGGIVAGSVSLSIAGGKGSDKQSAALDKDGRDRAAGLAQAEAQAKNMALWSFVGAGLCAAGTAAFYIATRKPSKAPVEGAVGLRDGAPAVWVQGRF
jgi:hypothetical protein